MFPSDCPNFANYYEVTVEEGRRRRTGGADTYLRFLEVLNLTTKSPFQDIFLLCSLSLCGQGANSVGED